MRTLTILSCLALAGLLAPARDARAEPKPDKTAKHPAQIQWFGTWAQAAAEAKRTGRPILLTSAAPQCRGISGIW